MAVCVLRRVQCIAGRNEQCRTFINYKEWPLFNKEKRAEQQQQLKAEFNQGIVTQLRSLRENGGRDPESPQPMLPLDSVFSFPAIPATNILGEGHNLPEKLKGKVSLVVLGARQPAEAQVENWMKGLDSAVLRSNNFQAYRLALIQSSFFGFSFARQALFDAIKKRLPAEAHSTFLVHTGPIAPLLFKLRSRNWYAAHVVLTDGNTNVRWVCTGDPRSQELEALNANARRLLSEIEGTKSVKVEKR